MDAWQRTFDQLSTVFRGLSGAQRLSVLVVTLGGLGGLGWLTWNSTKSHEEYLLGGKSFTANELEQTRSALNSAGLTRYRVIDQRIAVPANEVDRYTAAAVVQQALPMRFAADFERMQAKVNVFTSSEQRRELLEEARKTRLAQILRAIPDIEDAIVEWDRPKAASLFRPGNTIAAHVSVKPRGSNELTAERVKSLKLFVAGALAGATPDDVTVVDLNSSRVYGRGQPESTVTRRGTEFAKARETELLDRITHLLRHIPDVLVTVEVQLVASAPSAMDHSAWETAVVPVRRRHEARRIPHTGSRQSLNTSRIQPLTMVRSSRPVDLEQISPAETVDQAPAESVDMESDRFAEAVTVAVSIPDSYYAAVARSRGLSSGGSLAKDRAYRAAIVEIKAETQHDIKNKLLPALPDGTDAHAITISTHTVVKPDQAPRVETPLAGIAVLPWQAIWQQHREKIAGGAAVLAFCMVCWCYRPRAKATAAASPLAETSETVSDFPSASVVTPELPATDTVAISPSSEILDKLAQLEKRTVPFGPAPGLSFLVDLPVPHAADLLSREHPQTIALVATALPADRAAEILYGLPESLRWDVTQRLARIGPASPEILGEVASSLKTRADELRVVAAVTPSQANASSVAQSTPAELHDPKTDDWPLEFDELRSFDGQSLTTLLQAIDLRACAVALLDRSEAFKDALLSMVPAQVAATIRQHGRRPGPVRLAEIAAAQQAIAGVAWNLAQQGTISLPPHLQPTF